jgi:hypothetical protein
MSNNSSSNTIYHSNSSNNSRNNNSNSRANSNSDNNSKNSSLMTLVLRPFELWVKRNKKAEPEEDPAEFTAGIKLVLAREAEMRTLQRLRESLAREKLSADNAAAKASEARDRVDEITPTRQKITDNMAELWNRAEKYQQELLKVQAGLEKLEGPVLDGGADTTLAGAVETVETDEKRKGESDKHAATVKIATSRIAELQKNLDYTVKDMTLRKEELATATLALTNAHRTLDLTTADANRATSEGLTLSQALSRAETDANTAAADICLASMMTHKQAMTQQQAEQDGEPMAMRKNELQLKAGKVKEKVSKNAKMTKHILS